MPTSPPSVHCFCLVLLQYLRKFSPIASNKYGHLVQRASRRVKLESNSDQNQTRIIDKDKSFSVIQNMINFKCIFQRIPIKIELC